MNKYTIYFLFFLLINNSINSNAQNTIQSVHFTRFYNGLQYVIKVTNDTCYATDNIGRTSFRTQKVLTSNQFRDWENIKSQCLQFIKNCRIVESIPTLYPREERNTVVTEIYIKLNNKIYLYKEEIFEDKIPYNFKINDNDREFCLSANELFCKLYYRLL